MNTNVTLPSIIGLTFIISGLTISLVLWVFAKVDNRSNKILSATILSITVSVAIGFMIQTFLILKMPHFYRTGHIASLASYPLALLYIRSVLLKKGVEPSDLVFFIPVVFYIIDLLPFFARSGDEKIRLIGEDLYGYYAANDFDEGWLTPIGFHFYFRYLVMSFFWLMQLRILLIFYGRTRRKAAAGRLKSRWWLTFFWASQGLAYLPLLVRPLHLDSQWILAMISFGLPIPVATIWLFLRPEILYGLSRAKDGVDRNVKKSSGVIKNEGAINYKTPQEQELSNRLHEHMSKSKKFLQHRYTINRLAAELDIPPHQISTFLNQHMDTSFSEFLNKYRIEYSIERIKNGDARRLTLEALASECGFNNRNSFTTAFKRITGVTPSEFTRDLA